MKRYSRPMVILILALALMGCQKSDRELTAIEQGTAAIGQENYTGALGFFQQALSSGEDPVSAYRGEGIAYMSLGEYENAVKSFDKALNHAKEQQKNARKDILYYKASALYKQQKYEETISTCGQILDIGKEGDAFYLIGVCYLEKGDEQAAKVNFDAAVQANPKEYDIYLNIYEAYQEKKLSAKGAAYLQQALALEDESEGAACQKARIYYYLEDYEAAQNQIAALAAEKDPEALLLMGKIALALEDPLRSATFYQQYLTDVEETAEAYNGVALAQIAQEDYDAALSAISKGLKLGGEQGKQELYFNEIVALEYKRNFAGAKAKAEAYVAKYPADEAGQKEYEFLTTVQP